MGKKYNKGRTQKPNYSKRRLDRFQVEASSELSTEEIKKRKSSPECSSELLDERFSPSRSSSNYLKDK